MKKHWTWLALLGWVVFVFTIGITDGVMAFLYGALFGFFLGVPASIGIATWAALRSRVRQEEGIEAAEQALPYNWRVMLLVPGPYFRWLDRQDKTP